VVAGKGKDDYRAVMYNGFMATMEKLRWGSEGICTRQAIRVIHHYHIVPAYHYHR
jgi:hypothetical protein